MLYNLACTYSLLGDLECPLEYLARALAHGDWFKGMAEHDPDLHPLRNDPRFQALLKAS